MSAEQQGDSAVTAILVCPDTALAQEFDTAAAASRSVVVSDRSTSYPSARAVATKIANTQADALFLDVSTDRAAAITLLKAVVDLAPQLSVVAVNRSNDPEAILQCLRSGAAEFLSSPFPAHDFQQAVLRIGRRRTIEARPEPRRKGRLLAYVPVKGGAGCTTLAASIAYRVQAETKSRILLADMNLAGGVLSFLLRLRTPYTVIDALRHSSQLDESLWKSLVVEHGGIDILGAPERPEPPLIEPYPVQEMLDFARTYYDYVIADLGGVVDGVGMTTIATADEVNLVCSTDMPSLFLMRRMIPLVEEMGVARGRIHVLVNRVDKRSSLSTEDMEKIFRATVHASFPDDRESVVRAHREGSIVPDNTELGKAIKKYVSEQVGSEPAGAPTAFGALKQLWGGA